MPLEIRTRDGKGRREPAFANGGCCAVSRIISHARNFSVFFNHNGHGEGF